MVRRPVVVVRWRLSGFALHRSFRTAVFPCWTLLLYRFLVSWPLLLVRWTLRLNLSRYGGIAGAAWSGFFLRGNLVILELVIFRLHGFSGWGIFHASYPTRLRCWFGRIYSGRASWRCRCRLAGSGIHAGRLTGTLRWRGSAAHSSRIYVNASAIAGLYGRTAWVIASAATGCRSCRYYTAIAARAIL